MERRFSVKTGEATSDASLPNRGDASRGKTIDWSELLRSQRILLVAEAGAGKTHECEAQAEMLFQRGEPAFFLRLETVAAGGIRSSLFGKSSKKRFDDWRASSSQVGYFFLDSVDELQLVHGDFRTALKRLHEDLEGALGRATILVTSRPVDIDRRAFADVLPVPKGATDEAHGESFVRMAMHGPTDADTRRSPAFREVTLLPLSNEEVVEFARGQRVTNPEKLLEEIRARHAEDFARRPQDLIELCDGWRDHGRIGSHYEQLKSHIKARLRARAKRQEPAELTLHKARSGVQRLALAAILSRRLTIRHSAGADIEGSGDAPLIPDELLSDFSAGEIETLLQRPIFAEGGYGRVRFHHRSVLEFLAATEIDHLVSTGALAVSAAKRMLFSLSEAQLLLPKPSMRPVAGWLALLRPEIFDIVLKVEPSTALLFGDPESLSDSQCEQALRAYVERHGAGQWRGLELPNLQLERLARKPLQQVVLDAWSAGIENPEVRHILLKLIAAGRYSQCADLAVTTAVNRSEGDLERFEALDALVELDDHRIDGLIEAIASSQPGWGSRIRRWVAQKYYPANINEEQLVRLLTTRQRIAGRDDYFSSGMASVIERASVSRDRLDRLLPGLLELTRSLVVVVRDEDSLGDRKGRLQASYMLRALCIRLLEATSQAPDLVEAAVLGFRAAGYSSLDHERKLKLGQLINSLPSNMRQAVFEADYACVARLEPRLATQAILARLVFQGPLQYSGEKDSAWLLKRLANIDTEMTRRSVLLRMLVYLAPTEPQTIDPMRVAVQDSAALISELDTLLRAQTPTREMLEARDQQRKREERLALKQAGDKAAWTGFWTDLAKRPALALAPGRVKNTIWNVSTVLTKRSRGGDGVRWDREFLEHSFGGEVTDALRRSLMAYWRDMKPTLPSERAERNTYLVVWTFGLMGLYAEAEDPRWTRSIGLGEAELAVRYALVELNGLPDWLAALSDAHPQVVERIIGGEIESELNGMGGDSGWHSMVLQSLRYGRREIGRVLEDRLVRWLRGSGRKLMAAPHSPVAEAKLDHVVRVLLTHGSNAARRWLLELAVRQAVAAGQGPFLFFWLPVVMRLNPQRGVELLLHVLRELPVETAGVAVRAIGCLFGDRRAEGTTNLSTALPPETLLRLIRAIYRHVEPKTDERHEGAYSPGPRDNAEDGRRHVFDALIRATGAHAYQAKLTLSTDPLFAHARDRIAALAYERLAEETDASATTPDELARFFQGGELAPMTTTDMAHLLSDRLDDLQDLMGIDASPKAAWAMVTDENALRPAIARELDMMSKGAYTVDQEGVTVDGKETDIRFRAFSRYQASIELKIGEKPRSGKDLRDTIELQLVKKYMAARNARTGCLLVTVANPNKQWEHPETGELIDRHQLQEILTTAARLAQQRLGGDARVMARVLDLTPRLAKEPRRARGATLPMSPKPTRRLAAATKSTLRKTRALTSGR